MEIIIRIIALLLIIFAAGVCTGMLIGLNLKEKHKAKHRRKLWKS